MVSKLVASLLCCVAWVALAAAAGGAPGLTGKKLSAFRYLQVLTLSLSLFFLAVQPRLLWFNKGNNDRQQPIIIWQQPQQDSDRHHHHRPSWADYYYDYPPPPPPPRRPFGQSENPSGLSVIVINPNNVQNFTTPSSGTSSGTTSSTTSGRTANARIVDLLQNLQNSQGGILAQDEPEVINAVEAETDAAAAAAAAGIGAGNGAGPAAGSGLGALPGIATLLPQAVGSYGEEDARDDDFGDEELALLERQAARGLSPKHLLSFLMQDKRRRRFQEAVAGIYLRNYNLNRK